MVLIIRTADISNLYIIYLGRKFYGYIIDDWTIELGYIYRTNYFMYNKYINTDKS